MKNERLVIRRARKIAPRIPPSLIRGEWERVLLFQAVDGKIRATQLFQAFPETGGPLITGFTHYAILPKYIHP